MSGKLVYIDGKCTRHPTIDFDGDEDMLPDGVELWTVDATLPPPVQFYPATHTVTMITVEDRETRTRRLEWLVKERPDVNVAADERRANIDALGGNLRLRLELDRENRLRALEGKKPLTVDQYLDQISQQVNP